MYYDPNLKNQKRASLLSKLALFIIFPVVMGGLIWVLDQRGFFAISDIELQVMTTESQKAFTGPYVEELVQLFQALKGKSLLQTPLEEFTTILNGRRWIESFHAQREWPSKVVIQIHPKSIAFLMTSPKDLASGTFRPVAENGEMLPKVPTAQLPKVALLTGEVFAKSEAKRKIAVELKKALPATGRIAVDQISEISFDPKVGFSVRTKHSPYEIHFGESDFSEKASRVSQVIDYLDKKGLTPTLIDANLSKKVLVRMENGKKIQSF